MTGRVVVLLAIIGALLPGAGEREVAGRVQDATSGEPIAHARITVRLASSPQGAEVNLLSDTDGSFHITNLPEGGYQVMCEKAGYLTDSQWLAQSNSGSGTAAPMVLKLTAQAAIEGTVVDDRDLPMENTYLQLLRQMIVNGHRTYQTTTNTFSDETGHFRVFSLPAGRYYICIAARVTGPRSRTMAYPALFYPNVTDMAAAQPVDLKPGDEAQLPIKLPQPVPAHEIRGSVTGVAGNGGLSLTRLPVTQYSWPASADISYDSKTRNFRVLHVTAGTYLLTANFHEGRDSLQASATVTVSNQDIAGLKLEPVDNAIDGVLVIEGNAPKTPMFISLQSSRTSGGGPVDAEGKFHIGGLAPDTYRVMPNLNGALCLRSVLQSGRDVRDGLVVSADAASAPLEITLTGHCGSVEGTVSASDSTSSSFLTAMLLRKSGDELVLEKQAGTGPGLNGVPQFRFANITPGDYMLYVWPQEAQVEYANPEYMRQFESYGQAVTVTENNRVTVTVDKVLK